MKLSAPIALLTTFASLASALPLRIILPASSFHPNGAAPPTLPNWLLPLPLGPGQGAPGSFHPGPHHLHHFGPPPPNGPIGDILPPGLKAELERLTHLHHEGGVRVASEHVGGGRKEGGRKPCRGGKGAGPAWYEAMFGGGRKGGRPHHQQHQDGGSMMVIEPDGSRTFTPHATTPAPSGFMAPHHHAPHPHDPDFRPLCQRFVQFYKKHPNLVVFVVNNLVILLLFKAFRLIKNRRTARLALLNESSSSTSSPSTPPGSSDAKSSTSNSEKAAHHTSSTAVSPPDYYYSLALPTSAPFQPTPNSLLATAQRDAAPAPATETSTPVVAGEKEYWTQA